MIARHFLRDDMTAASGNEPAWTVGEERTYKGEIKLCETGYHSSPSWFAAVSYANGNMACIVEVSKPIEKDATKSVSKTRKLIAARNIESELRLWACDCAERALMRERDRGREPDVQYWNAIEVARRFARSDATAEELAAAWNASAAARAAAWNASAAAWDARAAAWNASAAAWNARAAARAASAAAWNARAAARDAEEKWQADALNARLDALFAVVTA